MHPSIDAMPLTWWERTLLALYQGQSLSDQEVQDVFSENNPYHHSTSDSLEFDGFTLMEVFTNLITAGMVFPPSASHSEPIQHSCMWRSRLELTFAWRIESLGYGCSFFWLWAKPNGSDQFSPVFKTVATQTLTEPSLLWLAGDSHPLRDQVEEFFHFLPKRQLFRRFKEMSMLRNSQLLDKTTGDQLKDLPIDPTPGLSSQALALLQALVPSWGVEVGIQPTWGFVLGYSLRNFMKLAKQWAAAQHEPINLFALVQEVSSAAYTIAHTRCAEFTPSQGYQWSHIASPNITREVMDFPLPRPSKTLRSQ